AVPSGRGAGRGKLAPHAAYNVVGVERAGGVPAILGELSRAGLLNEGVRTIRSRTLRGFLDEWDLGSPSVSDEAVELYHAAPGGVRTTEPYSQAAQEEAPDNDQITGCHRCVTHAG